MKKSKSLLLLLLVIIVAGVLRFYDINDQPPGLYIDEVSIGYNAYSILTTGKDEHGEVFPVFFKAFGEYKLPVYIYLTSASMALFGKTEFAVRFPSALFGTATILLVYLLLNQLRAANSKKLSKEFLAITRHLALLAAALLALSPWHIHFSRAGFEANVAIFFYLLGCLLAILFWRNKWFLLFLFSGISFILALYSYNTYRFVVPITWILFISYIVLKLSSMRRQIVLGAFALFVFCLPMVQFSLSSGGNARFAETAAFTEYKADTVVDKLIVYPAVFVKNYMSFFSLEFLFSRGDGNGRHQVPGSGLLFYWQFPFLLIGIVWLFKQKRTPLQYFTISLLLLAPVIPALARPSPHSLRALLMVIPLIILIALGLLVSYQYFKKMRLVFVSCIILIAGYVFALYLHNYYEHYKNVNALDWGAGYKKTAEKIEILNKEYSTIVVDSKLSFASIYFKFYAPSVTFTLVDIDWEKPKNTNEKILYVRPYYDQKENENIIDQVYLPGPNRDIFSQFWKL